MSAANTRLLLIVGAVVLSVLLFIAPTVPEPSREGKTKENAAVSANATLEVYVTMALKSLEPAQKGMLERLLAQKRFDSVVIFWDKAKRPDLAANFAEASAKLTGSPDEWAKAGNRYYYAVQFCQDKSEIPVLYQCAMRCFENALARDPKNTDARIMLASCYVEGTQNPMEGVTRLKEIEKTDSNNVKLQLTFAFFSVKSGQLDKAITRFNKVLTIDSAYIEAYLHLADAYEQQGNTGKTIEMLEKYEQRTSDPTARIEIGKYIQQLKTNK
jgi:tetratricopeptide (TPR) repeat protein